MKKFTIIKLLFCVIVFLPLSACNKGSSKTELTPTNTLNSNELYSQLQEASKQGNLEKIRQLIKQGANVNLLVWDKTSSKDENDVYASYQETPLMLASKKGHLDVVKELLAAGANVNQILAMHTEREMMPGEAQTALEMSCRSDNMDVVKALASAGTDTQSVLICACLHGNEELLQIALQKKPNLNFTTGEGGVSPLIMAAEKGYTNIVKALLEAGADPNYTDPFIETDYTALQAAKDYPEIIELLKQARANETKVSSLEQKNNSVKDNLKQADKDLILASKDNDLEKVKKAISAGANVNAKDENGNTALMYAIEKPFAHYDVDYAKEVIKALIAAGANVNAGDNQGDTTLMKVVYVFSYSDGNNYDREALIDTLVSYGADVNAKNKEGKSALMLIGLDGYIDYSRIAKKLLSVGANINAKDNQGRTVLMDFASKISEKEAIELYKDEGDYVIEYPNIESIIPFLNTLLAAGADVNAKDKEGNTAIQLAQKAGNEEIVKLLKSYGAKE